jgi:hypothetical protein
MSNLDPENRWRELAAQAATETDPTKLTQLMEQLCDALNVSHGENGLHMDRVSSAD